MNKLNVGDIKKLADGEIRQTIILLFDELAQRSNVDITEEIESFNNGLKMSLPYREMLRAQSREH
jgi:transposase